MRARRARFAQVDRRQLSAYGTGPAGVVQGKLVHGTFDLVTPDSALVAVMCRLSLDPPSAADP